MAKKQQIGSKIKKWLETEGYQVKLLFPKGFDFALDLFDSSGKGLGYSVSKPENIDVIGIAMNIQLPKKITDIVAKLTAGQKIELTQAMHRELLKLIQDHAIDKNLKHVQADERVYLDGLTKQKFMESFTRVRNVQLYLISVLRNKFGGEAVTTTSTPEHPMYR